MDNWTRRVTRSSHWSWTGERNAPAVVNANLVTRVFEAGGDASMDRTDVPYYPYVSLRGHQIPGIPQLVGQPGHRHDLPLRRGGAVDAEGKPLARAYARRRRSYKWTATGGGTATHGNRLHERAQLAGAQRAET